MAEAMAEVSERRSLETLTRQLSDTVKGYDDPSGNTGLYTRKKIINIAKEIIEKVKEPQETPFEYSVKMAEMGALRQFMEMHVFDKIPDEGSISYKTLAETIGAEESLITRMAWMLVATGMLKQVGEDRVAHSRFSKTYISNNPQGKYFQIVFDEGMVSYCHWPEYFRAYGYKECVNDTHTPHSYAWRQPEKNFWELISQDPQRLADFNASMETLDEVLPVMGMFDFSWVMQNAGRVAEDTALVVDVGGGKGQALKQILRNHREIPASRLVLQDRPAVIEQVIQADEPELRGVEKMVHDFFEEQPVKGALIYYIRRIMHDWSDEKCRKILSNLIEAMSPHSRILITEQIYLNPPTELPAQMDLIMLSLGGKERTKQDWYALTAGVGLHLVKFWETPGTEVAVIECEKAAEGKGAML